MTLNKTVFIILVIIVWTSCAISGDKKSMFFFFPESVKHLKENGYSYNEQTGFYDRKNGDTLESIREFNADSGSFSKHFYIAREPEKFTNVSEDSLQKISDYIKNGATRVMFDFQYHKILEFDNLSFYIVFGYSSKLNYYLIQYYNLRSRSDREHSIESLRNLKNNYKKKTDIFKIDTAIEYILNI